MQSWLRHSVWLTQLSPGSFVLPATGGAQTQMSCAGGGANTLATRQVDPPAQSLSAQHVSMQDFGVPVHNPERHSMSEEQESPAALPPVAGAVR
jgi:hypothetical protein